MSPSKDGRGFAAWYTRVAEFNVETLFSRKRAPGPPRTVYINEHLPENYFDHKHRIKADYIYPTNQIITSKYTVITFLPRNLLEQLRRIANIFFLVVSILPFIHKFSTISPGVAILPFIIILVITAAKDGYEDIKRHQSDKQVNHSRMRVLAGGDWKNPNVMEPKSKTFVRGLPPRRRRPQKTDPERASKLDIDSDIEYDSDGTDADVDRAGPHWKETRWEDLRVGDFVKIKDNEPFPADILICATSEDDNVAFVETKNLDGETNLKSRHATPALTHFRNAKACAYTENQFRINCDRPHTDMYRLTANIDVNGATFPVDLSMTFLRGTVLKNTRWAIGVVMYTGLDTKIVLNSGGTPSKRSKVERQMNPQVFINLIILSMIATACAIADALLEQRFYPRQAPWLYNDNEKGDNPRINGLVTWVFSFLTFQTIVPISLYISIEFVRTCQAAFIYFDADMLYEKTGQATICRSWNLSDDLGQIEYIFSDKTGTLTQNSMVFRQCSIGGRAYRGDKDEETQNFKRGNVEQEVYETIPSSSSATLDRERHFKPTEKAKDPPERFRDSALLQVMEDAISDTAEPPDPENKQHHRLLNGFFTVLGLCHTVLTSVDPLTGAIEYKAQSPDEAALVQAAADVGYVFCGRDKETLSLRTPFGEVEMYELLNILDFTSARKRMSVVIRKQGENGGLFLLTKGADNVIFKRLVENEGERELMEATERHLNEFANEGLRTLTLAYKVLDEEYYQEWSERYHAATISMDDREKKTEAVSDELEQNLRLLGATAIEDRLQHGVPETIADFKRAGIKIWVATGDRIETAIAIGRSTNLVANDSNIVVIRGGSEYLPVYQQMKRTMEKFFSESTTDSDVPRPSVSTQDSIALQRIITGTSTAGVGNGERPGGFVLVIDGAALLAAFKGETNKALLLRLGTMCEAVICCRVSPLQKALIVGLVRDGLGVMTLAIGDGANDVSMIQAADVGVGISGEEGLQAVNSSDYAIAQFRFLKKLLLVHGHWSYARNGTMILNFFYKNIVPVGVLWWFQIYCGWSANYVFDYTYILFWNSLWTIAPVIGIGLFDRFLDSNVLMCIPELYHYGREGTWFGLRSFFIYLFDGLYQSVIIYFLIMFAYFSPTSRADGYDTALYEWSTTMAISAVMVANIYVGFNSTAWTWWLVFAVFVGTVIVWAYTVLYSLISPGYSVTKLYGSYHFLFTSAYFWFSIPLTFLLALLPRYLIRAWRFGFAPDDLDTIRYLVKKQPDVDLSDARIGNLSAFRRTSPPSTSSRLGVNDSQATLDLSRRSVDLRRASRTDMATGLTSVDRGFDFAMEEDGVAMRRMQTNLSERRASSRHLPQQSLKGKRSFKRILLLKKKQ